MFSPQRKSNDKEIKENERERENIPTSQKALKLKTHITEHKTTSTRTPK